MHLRQPGFIYSACGPFIKNKERIQKFKETGDSQYIYQNELDKACFQHDMAYGDFKDVTRRTASDKILRDKAFDIAKNRKYDRYQRGLALMVYKFFIKKLQVVPLCLQINLLLKMKICQSYLKNYRKLKKGKVHSFFIDNTWGADLADMQLISKFNKGIHFLLCMIDIFTKYAWIIPLKDKKSITITNAFQKVIKESNPKLNKTWVDKGSEFYNRSMKSWLEKK